MTRFYLRRCRREALLLLISVGLALVGMNAAGEVGPLKVFLLLGQSNMQGHAHVRTFEHVGMDPHTVPLLRAMQGEEGQPRVCDDVWISSLSASGEKFGPLTAGYGANEDKIGPEFTFGIFLHQRLGEPFLIIKTAWGGKSLHTDFRSPSAGPYEFNETQLGRFKQKGKDLDALRAEKKRATGRYYRLMIDHVKGVLADIGRVMPSYDPEQGYVLAGMVWFQGWNDMVDSGVYPRRGDRGGYDDYSENLAHFIRDVRSDLNAPKLPFVIGVLGVGGPIDSYLPEQQRYKAIHQNFRLAMARPATQAEFVGNTITVWTERYWDSELTRLRSRESAARREAATQARKRSLTGQERKALEEKLRVAELTERERDVLKKGVSNGEYHYLGSAKILGQIGRGFADAVYALMEP